MASNPRICVAVQSLACDENSKRRFGFDGVYCVPLRLRKLRMIVTEATSLTMPQSIYGAGTFKYLTGPGIMSELILSALGSG